MSGAARIDGGFAEVEAGSWLMGPAQPAAHFGEAARRRRRGWRLPDRAALSLVETTGTARCSAADRPFLTLLPCAAPISAVSGKILVAPAGARAGASLLKAVPMSRHGALCITEFKSGWVVFATRSRTARLVVEDGGTLSVRPDAVVAWTGPSPTGFCPRLRLMDIVLPRGPRDLLFHFHGPSVVWVEGSCAERPLSRSAGRRAV